jgi:hypothetical protein
MDSPDMLSYYGLRFQVNQSLGRNHNTGQKGLYECGNLLLFALWPSYFVRILFLQGCGSWLWEFPSYTRIFNELQYNLQVWQGFINVSESFSYKDSLFILGVFNEGLVVFNDKLVILERTEFDLSKINCFRGVILLNPIVLVSWGRFPLCHTPIRPIRLSGIRSQS